MRNARDKNFPKSATRRQQDAHTAAPWLKILMRKLRDKLIDMYEDKLEDVEAWVEELHARAPQSPKKSTCTQ